ncbi:MAG: ATP-binding protein [Nannocystaceae bacterium]
MENYTNKQAYVLLKKIPLGLGLVKKDGRIAFVNDAFTKLLGYAAEDLTDIETWFHLAYPDPAYRAEVRKRWSDAVGTASAGQSDIVPEEYIVTTKDGRELPMEVGGIVLEDGVLATFADVRDRRRKEAALIAAKEAADSANRAKSRFLAALSHDIRTPLNPIINLTRLLLATPIDELQRDYLTSILNSSELLFGLLNDILDLAQIEAGKMELSATVFDLTAVLEQTHRLMFAPAQEKGLIFDFNVEPGLETLLCGDALRLQQVLLNLLSNAIKYTPAGTVALDLEVVEERADAVALRFSITDTGIGIAHAQQSRLFAEFSRIRSAAAHGTRGTGLGLVICKELVTLMGGEIGVESAPGRGSTFWFTVVLAKARQDEPQRSDPAELAALEERLGEERLRILLAEDNPVNQLVAKAMLASYGQEVRAVSNGREAIEAFEGGDYDLILMDIDMPEIDGVEATQIIRALSADGSRVPIVALTAHALRSQYQQLLSQGFSDHISKPIDPTELLRTILHHTRSRRSRVCDPLRVSSIVDEPREGGRP